MSFHRSLMFVACALFAQSVSLKAQYMQDTSSTYQDMWFSDTFVYITGSTAGSVSYHQYRVALTLRLPSGGVYSSTPGYSSGYVSNSLSAPWTAADLGADFVGDSKHDIYCTVSGVTPVLLFAQLKKRPSKPNYTCTAGTTNVCSDTANGETPLGTLKHITCMKWNFCCGGNNQFISGWCREETCNRYGAQTRDPVVSQCTNAQACQVPDRVLCLGLQ